jgi:cell division protein FtsL
MAAIQRPAALRKAPHIASGRLLLAIAAAVLIGAAAMQVNQFSAVTGTGYEIEELKRERALKQAANHDLEAEVASLSSLARVEIEARARLGMEPPKDVEHINIVGAVPDHQTLPTRYLPAEPVEAESDENPSFVEKMLDLLPF